MNTILLQPTDVLFFRDGRPMSGSLAGHTAAWPLPDVTNHALHAALHRAELEKLFAQPLHKHRPGRCGQVFSQDREKDGRQFGSLLTAGPFPVRIEKDSNGVTPTDPKSNSSWFFPRPKDAQEDGSACVTLRPVAALTKANDDPWLGSSLPDPIEYAVANTKSPDKEAGGEPWISTEAFNAYLRGDGESFNPDKPREHFLRDDSLADREANLGIAIDPETQTTGQGAAAGKIHTAHYLRLREKFRLGVLAKAEDNDFRHPQHGPDLIKALFNGHPTQIVVGGQQRTCTAELKQIKPLPLPNGLSSEREFESLSNGKFAVKWVLLSPAVWPEILDGASKRGTERRYHPGGWLPNWICPESGTVLLRVVAPAERRRRRSLNYDGKGYETHENADEIGARLVAAIVPKPIVVTGWALGLPEEQRLEERDQPGAKSTHIAVPAGAVYYFEADSAEHAVALAGALNWHGATQGTEIKNRRSTLMGEKGFGLGVCGTWKPFGDVQ